MPYIIGFLVVALILLLVIVGIYNRLVRGRNEVQGGWAQIEVQLKRRADLVPNLVEVVREYAAHEKSTMEAVIRARAAAQQANSPQDAAAADSMLTSAFRGIFALAESYPQLRAAESFILLQRELSDTETMVAGSRSAYNESVRRFNTAQSTFPAVLFASLLKFKHGQYFETSDPSIHQPPQINL